MTRYQVVSLPKTNAFEEKKPSIRMLSWANPQYRRIQGKFRKAEPPSSPEKWCTPSSAMALQSSWGTLAHRGPAHRIAVPPSLYSASWGPRWLGLLSTNELLCIPFQAIVKKAVKKTRRLRGNVSHGKGRIGAPLLPHAAAAAVKSLSL